MTPSPSSSYHWFDKKSIRKHEQTFAKESRKLPATGELLRHYKKIIKQVNKWWEKIIFIDKYIESKVSFKIALLIPSAGPISSFEVSPWDDMGTLKCRAGASLLWCFLGPLVLVFLGASLLLRRTGASCSCVLEVKRSWFGVPAQHVILTDYMLTSPELPPIFL